MRQHYFHPVDLMREMLVATAENLYYCQNNELRYPLYLRSEWQDLLGGSAYSTSMLDRRLTDGGTPLRAINNAKHDGGVSHGVS
jgi:hypothetical protein